MLRTLTVLVPNVSPGVNLFLDIVETLVKLLHISFLSLNIRAVLLELGGHAVTADLC